MFIFAQQDNVQCKYEIISLISIASLFPAMCGLFYHMTTGQVAWSIQANILPLRLELRYETRCLFYSETNTFEWITFVGGVILFSFRIVSLRIIRSLALLSNFSTILLTLLFYATRFLSLYSGCRGKVFLSFFFLFIGGGYFLVVIRNSNDLKKGFVFNRCIKTVKR